MDTRVGPISVDVVEPLRKLARPRRRPNEHGIRADLSFTARAAADRGAALHSPHRAAHDLRLDAPDAERRLRGLDRGRRASASRCDPSASSARATDRGACGRSVPRIRSRMRRRRMPQFYWLWAPLNFDDDRVPLSRQSGRRRATAGIQSACHRRARRGRGRSDGVGLFERRVQAGHAACGSATIQLRRRVAATIVVELEPQFEFLHVRARLYASRVGARQLHWRACAPATTSTSRARWTSTSPLYLHVQAFCRAHADGTGRPERAGVGVLEQLIIGPHEPSRLYASCLDGAH